MSEKYYEMLVKSLLPYRHVWEEMIKSGYFPLNERQLVFATQVLKNQSMENMNCSEESFQNRISLILIILSDSKAVIDSWRLRQNSLLSPVLHLPVSKLNISQNLRIELSFSGITLGEILRKYSETELLGFKNWSNDFTLIVELRKYLSDNNCETALIRNPQDRIKISKRKFFKETLTWIFNELASGKTSMSYQLHKIEQTNELQKLLLKHSREFLTKIRSRSKQKTELRE